MSRKGDKSARSSSHSGSDVGMQRAQRDAVSKAVVVAAETTSIRSSAASGGGLRAALRAVLARVDYQLSHATAASLCNDRNEVSKVWGRGILETLGAQALSRT